MHNLITIRHAAGPMLAGIMLLGIASLPAATQVIALNGDPAPGTAGGFFSYFATLPPVNSNAQVAFIAAQSTSTGTGVFRKDGSAIVPLILPGQSAPDGNGVFAHLVDGVLALNDLGQVAHRGFFSGTSGNELDDLAVFRLDGNAPVVIARENQNLPDGNGRISTPNFPTINSAGRVYFQTSLRGTSGGVNDDSALAYGDGSALTVFARKGQNAPGGNGRFGSFFYNPAVNQANQAAFAVDLTATSGGTTDNVGLFRYHNTNGISLARRGQTTPSGNGKYHGFSSLVLSDTGVTAFQALLNGASGGADAGIFLADGETVTEVLRKGEFAPGTTDALDLAMIGGINRSNHLVISGYAGPQYDHIILHWNGSNLTTIARTGDKAPGGNGVIDSLGESAAVFGGTAINDQGQIAFFARLSNTSGGAANNLAIYLYDPRLGLLEVARTGRALLEGTISNLRAAFGQLAPTMLSFNHQGQVAYHFELADGRVGFALWTPPKASQNLGISRTSDTLRLSFSGIPFRTYQIAVTDDLTGNFVDLDGTDTAGPDGEIMRDEAFNPSVPRRFYHLREIEPE